ncbi:MAG: M48 family metallopeptidase [Verrucomicrobiota bacterium]
MSGEEASYAAFVTHPSLGGTPAAGAVCFTQWVMRFEGETFSLECSLDNLRIQQDAENQRVFFRHPEYPDWVVCVPDLAVLDERCFSQRTSLRLQLTAVAEKQDSVRRVKWTLSFLAAFAVVSVTVLWMAGKTVRYLVNRVPLEYELKLGDQLVAEVRTEQKLVTNATLQADLEKLVGRLVAALPKSERKYHVYLVEDPTPNAFAIPGGHIFVHTGLMRAAQTPEEVAGVLAHEIAHVTRRHGFHTIVSAIGPLYVFKTFFSGNEGLVAVIAAGSTILVAQNYSREYEREADDTGWDLLVAANIDPRGLATFLNRLLDEEKKLGFGKGVRALSSHPPSEERIARLEKRWNKLKKKTFAKLDPLQYQPPKHKPLTSSPAN